MPELVRLVFYGILVAQYPFGLLMYYDAKRLDLKNPEMYLHGVVVPAAGFLVMLYYVSERKNLPKRETEET